MSSFNLRTGQTKKQNLRFRDEFDTKNEVKPPDNFTLALILVHILSRYLSTYSAFNFPLPLDIWNTFQANLDSTCV